jgi:probable rRNA maturation factor
MGDCIVVEIYNAQDVIQITPALEALVKSAVAETLAYEKNDLPLRVEVLFVDNPEIHRINLEHRHVDSVTDVLSFPMLESDENHRPILTYQDGDYDMENNQIFLGDIVISLECALQQAKDFNHSFERETAYLTVHSVLHLLGYDHETEEDKKVMRIKEEAILKKMDLSRDAE